MFVESARIYLAYFAAFCMWQVCKFDICTFLTIRFKISLIDMEKYDKEFLEYMEGKYKITLEKATNGSEMEIIRFALAWDVWKQSKKVCKEKLASQ